MIKCEKTGNAHDERTAMYDHELQTHDLNHEMGQNIWKFSNLYT